MSRSHLSLFASVFCMIFSQFSFATEDRPIDAICVGTALMDYLVCVSEDYVAQIEGEKGGDVEIDYKTFQRLIDGAEAPVEIMMGGSGMNQAKGLAALGWRCAAVSKLGNDPKSDEYLGELLRWGIEPHMFRGDKPTGRVLCLITPDGQRTMRTLLDDAEDLSMVPFPHELFARAKIVYITGYICRYPEVLLRAAKVAKESGCKIAMDLACFEIVRDHLENLTTFLPEYVDILFCNDDEAAALTGLPPKEALSRISEMCEIAVVTVGANGCYVQSGQEQIHCPAIPTEVTDTTGAGDLFASGFLHGYLRGDSLMDCSWCGNLVASWCIRSLGAEVAWEAWPELRAVLDDTSPKTKKAA